MLTDDQQFLYKQRASYDPSLCIIHPSDVLPRSTFREKNCILIYMLHDLRNQLLKHDFRYYFL